MVPTTPSTATPSGRRLSAFVRLFRGRLGDFTGKNAINAGAVGGACLLLGTTDATLQLLGALAALASLVAVVWRRRQSFRRPGQDNLLGYFVSLRAVLFFALGAGYLLRDPDDRGWIWAAVAVAVMVVLSEPLTKALLDVTKQVVVNLPGVRSVPDPAVDPSWLSVASVLLLGIGGVLAVLAVPGWVYFALTLVLLPVAFMVVRYAVHALSVSRRAERNINRALHELKPAFVIYYAAIQGARYQLAMWLPYLERLGEPYVVITRFAETVPVIRELTSAPILVPKVDNVSASLDTMVVPSLKAAFYIQGDPKNQTMQRYRKLTHVWLNHGDSDKQANFHPRHATFDKLFVAGQQGIERYAQHGIVVPEERFAVVGRPQIEEIEIRDHPLPPDALRTVLYAPTWRGGRPSTNYSSLPIGTEMVRALLERGATVIFRPHPLSYDDRQDAQRIRTISQLLEADRTASGRQHVWGAAAEKERSVAACYNDSDALIADVSSIANDYLASGKPFAMCAITRGGAAFVEEFPTARAAYVIERDLSTLPRVLDALLGEDTLAPARLAYRTYCLGPWVGGHAAEEFLRVAGALVRGKEI